MKKSDILNVEKEFKSDVQKNKMIYAIIGVIAVVVIVMLIVLFTRGGKEEVKAVGSVQEAYGNSLGIAAFEMNWRYFQGFVCGENPLLAINANTFSGLKNVKISQDSYLDCWYQVGKSYIKENALPDEFSIWIGSFNPYKAYDVSLCCKVMDFNSGDKIGEASCRTQRLEPMCK